MLTSVKSSFRNIFRKKVMSVLTIGGIAIGVMSVVIITIIGDVGKDAINQELNSMGIGGIMVRSATTATMMEQKELDIIKAMDTVYQATPFITEYSDVQVKGKGNDCVLWGVDDSTQNIISLEMLHGRMITQSDIKSMAKVCVVDESFAQKNYSRSNIVGKVISVFIGGAYQDFEIVGVTKTGGDLMQNLMGSIVPCFAYVPYTTMLTLSSKTEFGQIVLKLKENIDVDTTIKSITSVMNDSIGALDSVIIDDLNQQKDSLNSILNIVTVILTIIAGISLLVAGLSIMTVMLVSINERTREIGIKKSIGATNASIMIEFLSESVMITSIGALIGALFGIFFGVVGCVAVGIDVIINAKTIILSVLFAISVGTIFGVYPALKAAKLKPVDALRYE